MELLSVNIGRPRLMQYQNQTLSTAIFKQPVAGPVAVSELGIEGDDQADKRVHGGVDKAVYAYSDNDYAWWREQLANQAFEPGTFGENLTTRGLASDDVHIGDRYRIGTVLLEVTQPRQPCMKLGARMRDATFVKQFHQASRPGCYFRVIEPGTLQAGDAIELVDRLKSSLGIAEIYRLRFDATAPIELLRTAAQQPRLSDAWRDDFHQVVSAREQD